jgi:aminoglycoside phosphotransferase (APT) family kinase protein
LAICDEEEVIGAPFYLMNFVDGLILTAAMPAALEGDAERIAAQLVDGLVELHAVDPAAEGLAGLGRPDGYLERQLARFGGLLEVGATRPLPDLEVVADWLAAGLPDSPAPTVVHGDYRLGNMMVDRDAPTRIVAVLDWEMGAIGDPRADVGYLLATYSEPHGRVSALGSSPVTATPGFPSRAQLVERYAASSGRDVEPLAWFEALALWKAAVFCEAIYGRYIRGELGAEDTRAAMFEVGVPLLAETALEALSA